MSDYMSGEELLAIRRFLGITQAELAKKIGISRTFVGLMERGQRQVTRRTAKAVWSVMPRALDRQAIDTDPTLRRLEEALIEQGISFERYFNSNGQQFDFFLPSLSMAIVVDRDSTSNTRPTNNVRNIIVARGGEAAALLSLLLERQPLKRGVPPRHPISV